MSASNKVRGNDEWVCRIEGCSRIFDSLDGRWSHESQSHPEKLNPPWQDKKILKKHYEERNMSARDLADKFSCNKSTILKWLRKHNIARRDRGQAVALSRINAPISITTTKRGYEYVFSTFRNQQYRVAIHRLLAVSEYGFDAVNDKAIHHKNNIPWDNRPSNIEPLSNSEHSSLHENDPQNRPWQDRELMRYMKYEEGLSYNELAEEWGCSISTIYRWLNRHDLLGYGDEL